MTGDWITLGKLIWFAFGILVGSVVGLSVVFLLTEPQGGRR